MDSFAVLFVCVGNVCRSPLGERLLATHFPQGPVTAASAGVGPLVGAPMDPEAAAELERRGGSALGFVAQRLTSDLVKSSDLVLTATKEIRERTLQEAPGGLRRTFTVKEFAAIVKELEAESLTDLVAKAAAARSRAQADDMDIEDPFRQSAKVHAVIAQQMADAVGVIAARLAEFGT